MFLDRSAHRIFVGASNVVSSNFRLVRIPASLTLLSKTVPTPTGPSVVCRISWTRGLNFGSLVPSPKNANTTLMGRSTMAEALNSCAMPCPIVGICELAFAFAQTPSGPRLRPHPQRPGEVKHRAQGHVSAEVAQV